jgi:preprotein translocase subunit SecF
MGGPTIHGFAFAMIIGILTGTYSSIYVAAPLLLIGKKHAVAKAEPDRKGPGERISDERRKSGKADRA